MQVPVTWCGVARYCPRLRLCHHTSPPLTPPLSAAPRSAFPTSPPCACCAECRIRTRSRVERGVVKRCTDAVLFFSFSFCLASEIPASSFICRQQWILENCGNTAKVRWHKRCPCAWVCLSDVWVFSSTCTASWEWVPEPLPMNVSISQADYSVEGRESVTFRKFSIIGDGAERVEIVLNI